MSDWRIPHDAVIKDFMAYLNASNNRYVLKGGTALYLCYQLNRFSEDIDLDSSKSNIIPIVESFCKKYSYTYRVAKNTPIVQRCMIDYGNTGKPLKVEISYRRREIPVEETTVIHGIRTYTINHLCAQKASAYAGRDKVRDLFDLSFIYLTYKGELTPETISLIRHTVAYKGIEQYDYVVREQQDELIDTDTMAENFLAMFSDLGLMHE